MLADGSELRLAGVHALAFERHYRLEGIPHLQHFAWRNPFAGNLAHKPLEVSYGLEVFKHIVPSVGVAEEMLYYIEAFVDCLAVFERHLEPTSQQACPHRCHSAVYYTEKTFAVRVEWLEKLKVAHREAVESHILACLYPTYRRDVLYACVLCKVKVVQHRTCRYDGRRHTVYAKTLERSRRELLAQPLVGCGRCEKPVLKLEHRALVGKLHSRSGLAASLHKKLLWCHRRQSLVDIVGCTLGRKELARGDIEQSQTRESLPEMDGRKEIVLAPRKHCVAKRYSRGHKFRDTTFYKLLGKLRVLELLADCNALTGTHKLGQISIEGMVRKAGQLHILRHSVGSPRKSDTEYLRSLDSVVAESLVEIAHTEEQYCVGMLGLHLGVLLHQRSLHNLLGHSLLIWSYFPCLV